MSNATDRRLLSLDVLRGFDMFWIIGGHHFFSTLSEQTDWGFVKVIESQLHHARWVGFHAFDLIFPLFMFISGVSIPYALFGKIEKGVSKKNIYLKVFKRAILLVILGIVYNGGLDFDFENFRVASVLGQIGLSYLIASIIAINNRSFKSIAFWVFGILLAYTFLQLVVPVPGFGSGMLTPEGSINGYVDRLFLPGKLFREVYDPEGILCIISASSVILMGALSGILLRSSDFNSFKKVTLLCILGILLIVLSLILNVWYPIIKKLWTPAFNLLSGGISFLLLAAFYLIIDVLKFQRWILFFRVIGMNSIAIYMAIKVFDFSYTSKFIFGGVSDLFGNFGPVMLIIGMISLEWLLLYFLYKRNIFLKV